VVGSVAIQLSCSYALTTNAASFSAAGGSGSVSLTVNAGCPWTVVNSNGWITIASATNGTGGTTVNYSVAANPTMSARSGVLVIGGLSLAVTQDALVCSYALDTN